MQSVLKPSDELCLPYPNTCEDCEDRGAFAIWCTRKQDYVVVSGDFVSLWDYETQEYQRRTLCWPKRCKSCHGESEKFRRANGALKELEHQRTVIQEYFDASALSPERWAYLKFVTLTWKQDWTKEPMNKGLAAAARKWVRHKRDKIAKHLDVAGGIDVLEFVTKKRICTISGEIEYYHNLHTHGIWIMPYHDIEFVGKIMSKYVGRDTTRAVMDKEIIIDDKDVTLTAFMRGRKYLLKYLTKHPDSKRSRWGTLRKDIDLEQFILDTMIKWTSKA